MSWLIKSSIGRKVIQSISGLFLILFLLFHMSMNVVLIFSHETYDFLANEILGANWWAIVGTLIIGLGVGVHIIYAIILTLQNWKARGRDRYASKSKTPVAWSSKNMFVLGVFIALFLIVHMYQMWYQMQFKDLLAWRVRHDGAQLVAVDVLSQTWVLIAYVVAFIALWFREPRLLECTPLGRVEQRYLDEKAEKAGLLCLNPYRPWIHRSGYCRALRILQPVSIT